MLITKWFKPTHNPQFLQSLWWRVNTRNINLLTLWRGQFTLSTQSITQKKPCYTLSLTQPHSFFRNLPPLTIVDSLKKEKKTYSLQTSTVFPKVVVRYLFHSFSTNLKSSVQETKNYENGAHNYQSAMKKKLLSMGYLIGLISKKACK